MFLIFNQSHGGWQGVIISTQTLSYISIIAN